MLKGDPSKPGGIEFEWSIKLVACADDGNVMVENMEEQDRQCTYKFEARSCNHSCSGKAISIIYCDCVCVALGIQHAMRVHLLSFVACLSVHCGPGNVVGIATGYGLDGPGIESRWGAKFSTPVQTGPGAHPASCTIGTRSFPGVKSGRGVTLTPHPLLVPWSRKSRAIPLLPL